MIIDDEFGEVIVRRSKWARGVKFSVSTSGRLQISAPAHASERTIRRLLTSARAQIRRELPVKDPTTQRARDTKKKLLMSRARVYLPYRLEFWARKFGYTYARCRLSHANTRWGSCSGSGTISLNIGLMQVPEVLRDYVILHELAHLHHMDHSPAFWAEVGAHDPRYKDHRRKLKHFSPGV